tara:strand:- start:423 stop:623 length:201 start_codon:yes stop_codon:yes gene_type:complete
MEELTQEEEIAQHYSAMLDSANLIDSMDGVEDEDKAIERNVEHLKIMLTKDYWTDEDLTVFDKYFE